MRHAGLTLIEMLCVIALLAMVSGVLAVRLGATGRDAELRAFVAECRDLDRRARVLAARSGPVVVEVDDEGTSLGVRGLDGAEGMLLRVTAPSSVQLDLETADGAFLVIDRHGRSADYRLTLYGDDAGTVAWDVQGVLGAVTEVQP